MEIKNLVTISLTAFITALIIILGAGALQNQNKPAAQSSNSPGNSSGSIITMSQVSQHNSASDCWTIVDGKVYDVTNLIPIHSGGAGAIIPYCGKDATTAFDMKNGRGPHSQSAQNALQTYYVGNFGR
jgi:cytochrome b involved in lipid metabolism